jgi:3-hydroxybutyryl-CoA dehydrogenase
MEIEQIKNIGVIGAGLMGHGIAQEFALHGYKVNIFDANPEILRIAKVKIKNNFKVFIELEMVSEDDVERCLGNITLCDSLAAMAKDVHLVVEAASEDMNVKRQIFKELEQYVFPDTILCSNTSSMSITEISKALQRKERLAGTHFWNPPHIVPCVEVTKGNYTCDQAFETVYNVMKKIKKEPVRVLKDMPGFLGNRLQHAMMREAFSLVENNIALPEDIDKVLKYSFGLRSSFIGPCETADLIGLDLTYTVLKYTFPSLDISSKPSKALTDRIEEGKLGVKTGQGFYNWTPEKIDRLINQRDRVLLKIIKVIAEAENSK